MDVADLRIGMYVCRLDRPWEGTPFPLQGVALDSEADIRALRSLCKEVYIDVRRSAPAQRQLTRTHLATSRFRTAVRYHDVPVASELPRAGEALGQAMAMVDVIFHQVTSGQELSAQHVEDAVMPIVGSVLRSADAFFWVEGLRRHDSYSYSHAIGCSALAAAFGRHMGFAEGTIVSLAAGGLLMDMGKTQVPQRLLEHAGALDAEQTAQVREHVAHGLRILAGSNITDSDVADIVGTHHERHDGSGYPHGLAGTDIPMTGRMLGIIDAYDAMTSARPYRAAMTRHHALRQLYAERDVLFQSELVEQFQVCLGVYPTGSLVELSTGEVAVVMAQNRVRRLRPRVVVLTDALKQPRNEFLWLDLMAQKEGQPAREVLRALAAGSYGIDAADLFLDHDAAFAAMPDPGTTAPLP